ncbi:hypothetical protein KC929_00415 [Patescibacteria group bacterium]|nr:hypothetical protein [Patescibacteria group bacterium]
MNTTEVRPRLDAYRTEKGNYFVIFHEYYGAYFNQDLNAFIGENPVRVEVEKEEDWIKRNWGKNAQTIELDEFQSENLIKIVENDQENGLPNIREKVDEEYAWEDEDF